MSAYSKDGRLLKCAYRVHPSEILIDELKARGIKKKEFVRLFPLLKGFVYKRENVTNEIALEIERATGIKSDGWLRLQKDFDNYENE
jgi:plasmid maintenance system antidote protein VapI